MIYIKTKRYPAKGYNAITHWPFVFYKKDSLRMRIHEEIHGKQQKELLIVPFYLIYFIEWLFRGYKNISFEKEAYKEQDNYLYLHMRKPFGQWRQSKVR